MAFLMATRRTAASASLSSSTLFTRFLKSTIPKPSAAFAPVTTTSVTSTIPVILGDEPRITVNALGGSFPRSEQVPLERGGYCDEYINPFQTSGSRGSYEVNHVDEGLYVRMDMPGVDKEDVKVWVDYGTVYVKGTGNKQSRFEKLRRAYGATIELPSDTFQENKIKVDMKNGVLRLLIPNLESTM